MSESKTPPPSTDELQFATAETAEAGAADLVPEPTCAACGQPIVSTYYAVGETVVCPACEQRLNAQPAGSALKRLFKASFLGIGAALLGGAIWFAIRRLMNLEFGLVAILVGFLVGKAVRKGSENKGGLGYQFLAVLLTYCGIASNYVPDLVQGALQAREDREAIALERGANADPAADVQAEANPPDDLGFASSPIGMAILIVLACVLALAAPVLSGMESPIGLLIVGFALWEAWKFNAYQKLPISGPYQLGAAPQG